jgi:hypothetical protein
VKRYLLPILEPGSQQLYLLDLSSIADQEVKMHKHQGVWLFSIAILMTTANVAIAQKPIAFMRLTPLVVTDESKNVILEAAVAVKATDVKLALQSSGKEVPFNDNGINGDRKRGDGIYTGAIDAADVRFNLRPQDVNRKFVGYLRVFNGQQQYLQLNLFVDIMTAEIPVVSVRQIAKNIQASEHLVNIVEPSFFKGIREGEGRAISQICKKFYANFPDNYDFINLIYGIPHPENRHHFAVRNDIKGIGMRLFDNGRDFGSQRRLKGITVFPLPTFFDGASPDYQHELGHQWINHLSVPPFNQGIPHWPLSDLAKGIMGYGSQSQGLDFGYDLRPDGDGYTLIRSARPKEFTDLDLYLMGFIPAAEVGTHIVFNNQNQNPKIGGKLEGPVTTVSAQMIVEKLGQRIPNSQQSPKEFRIATVIVSEEPLPEEAMRLYNYFAVRAEETKPVPYSSGFVRATVLPFHLTTGKRGSLITKIDAPISETKK